MTASMLEGEGFNHVATFIFCKLNHPEEEDPVHLRDAVATMNQQLLSFFANIRLGELAKLIV